MKPSLDVIKNLQRKYDYLINYESSDPSTPIDPLTYIDSNGDSLLHIAAQLGDVETLSVLVNAGLNIDLKGDMGSTALHYAYESNHLTVVEFLLAHGASAEIRNDFGKCPSDT